MKFCYRIYYKFFNFIMIYILLLCIIVLTIYSLQSSTQTIGLIIFLFCIILGIAEKDLFNPFFLFSLTSFTLSLYNPAISYYFLTPLSYKTEKIIFFSLFAYLLGMIFAKTIKIKFNNLEFKSPSINGPIIYVLLFLGLLPIIIGLPKAIIALAMGNLLEAKKSFSIPIINNFIVMKFLSVIMAFATKKTIIIIVVVLLTLISVFININKFEIAILFFCILISLYKYKYITL